MARTEVHRPLPKMEENVASDQEPVSVKNHPDISKDNFDWVERMYSAENADWISKQIQHTHTPFALCDEILEKIQIQFNYKVLVISSIEFVVLLLDKYKLKKENVFFLDEGCVPSDLKPMKRAIIQASEMIPMENVVSMEQAKKMKFDFVVGNPPFTQQLENTTNTSKLYDKISEIAIGITRIGGSTAMIVPSVFTNTASKFGSLLEQNGVFFIKNLNRDHFDIDMSCLYFICQPGKKVNGINVQQSNNKISIKNKVHGCFSEFGKPENNLGVRWRRGKLNRNAFVSGENEIVEICGKAGEPPVISRVSNDEHTARNVKKVVINNMGSLDGFGQVKIAPRTAAVCFSVVAIILTEAEEEQFLLEYLQSDFVRDLVRKVKTSTPNSKNCFEYIPNFVFDKPISKQMFLDALGIDENNND